MVARWGEAWATPIHQPRDITHPPPSFRPSNRHPRPRSGTQGRGAATRIRHKPRSPCPGHQRHVGAIPCGRQPGWGVGHTHPQAARHNPPPTGVPAPIRHPRPRSGTQGRGVATRIRHKPRSPCPGRQRHVGAIPCGRPLGWGVGHTHPPAARHNPPPTVVPAFIRHPRTRSGTQGHGWDNANTTQTAFTLSRPPTTCRGDPLWPPARMRRGHGHRRATHPQNPSRCPPSPVVPAKAGTQGHGAATPNPHPSPHTTTPTHAGYHPHTHPRTP